MQLQGRDKYLIGTFYSPRTADVNFIHNFNLNLEKAMEVTKTIIIVRDLNEDLNNKNVHHLTDILTINTIHSPTRQHAILDPIIIPDDMPFLDSGTIDVPDNINDHKATYIRVTMTYQRNLTYTRLVWLYKRANFALLMQKNVDYDWNCLLQGSLDEASERFTSTLNNVYHLKL